jgi:hypothetical protein
MLNECSELNRPAYVMAVSTAVAARGLTLLVLLWRAEAQSTAQSMASIAGISDLPAAHTGSVLASQRWIGPVLRIDSARAPSAVAAAAGWPYELTMRVGGPRGCPGLFAHKMAVNASTWPPPTFDQLTPQMQAAYTLGGAVRVVREYFQSRANGGRVNMWPTKKIERYGLSTRSGRCPNPSYHTTFPCDSLRSFPPAGNGLVIGSQDPWLEAAILAIGGSAVTHLTTHEFSRTRCLDRAGVHSDFSCSRLTVVHPADAYRRAAESPKPEGTGEYDFVVSYSSLEHDGFGRYGDPLNPSGDLESVQLAYCLMRPGALLYLGLPMTLRSDFIKFNGARVYGPLRRALLTANFELLGVYGAMEDYPPDSNAFTQPMLVLRKPAQPAA